MDIKELIDKINEAKIKQTTYFVEQEFPEDIQKELSTLSMMNMGKPVDVDKRRWYEKGYLIFGNDKDEYIGIEFIITIYNEYNDYEDMEHTIKAKEFMEVLSVSYEPVQ